MRKLIILFLISYASICFASETVFRLRALGKCRLIKRNKCEVRVLFMNEEDAEMFSRDLREFINE